MLLLALFASSKLFLVETTEKKKAVSKVKHSRSKAASKVKPVKSKTGDTSNKGKSGDYSQININMQIQINTDGSAQNNTVRSSLAVLV